MIETIVLLIILTVNGVTVSERPTVEPVTPPLASSVK